MDIRRGGGVAGGGGGASCDGYCPIIFSNSRPRFKRSAFEHSTHPYIRFTISYSLKCTQGDAYNIHCHVNIISPVNCQP